DLTCWRGTGRLFVRRLEVQRWPLRQAAAEFTLVRGRLGLVAARGELLGADVRLSGALELTSLRYNLGFEMRGFEMAKLALIVPADWSRFEVLGHVEADGRLEGSLSTPSLGEGQGRLRVVGLRLGKLVSGAIQSRWRLADQRFSFPDIQGQLFGGLLTGKGSLTRREANFALYLAGVDAAEAARRVPEVEFPIRGRANLKTTLQIGFSPLRADVAVDLNDSRVWVAGLPVRELRGSAQVRNGRLDYMAQGDLLGGRLRVEGRYPPPPVSPVGQPHGRFRVDRLVLGRILEALVPELPAGGWEGTVSLDLPYRFDGVGGSLTGRGRFELRDLRYKDQEISDSLRGDVRLVRQGVYLRDVSGTVAGGLLRFQGAYRFDDASRGWFNLGLSGADLAGLAALLDQRQGYKGQVNLQFRGNLGQEWRGSGEARLTRGTISGVSITEWSLPLEFTFVPSRHAAEVTFRESSARLGDGRARVRARLTMGQTMRAEGVIQLREASVGALAGLFGDVTDYVQGKINGRLDLGGGEMRSLTDLNATVQLTLRDTQALQLPILRQLAPLISIPGGRAAVFREGRLEGRLARGIFRIREFTLENAVAQMIIQGNVTTVGRLDLDVIARTAALGNINPVGLRLILGRIPAIGPIPVGLLVQATEFLSARVLHFKVRGTTRAAVIQIEPLGLLSQEAARFLLSRLAAR
ncbi:MAG: AsmA-like C-terminal region-containing protein, partial [Gemmataceae bacterium]